MFCMLSVSIFSSGPIEITLPFVDSRMKSRLMPAAAFIAALMIAPAALSVAMKTPAFFVTRSSVTIDWTNDFSGKRPRWKTDRPTNP